MNASVPRVKVFIWMVIIQIRWKFNTHQIHLYRLSAAALIQRAAWEGPQKRKKKILASSLICRFSLDDKLGWKLSKRNKRHTNLGQRQSIFFAKKMSFFFFPLFFSFSSCVSHHVLVILTTICILSCFAQKTKNLQCESQTVSLVDVIFCSS